MAQRCVALLLAIAIAAPGCASAGMRVADTPGGRPVDPAVMAEYVQKLPLGSHVRVERTTGRAVRGTLMKAWADAIVVQPRTRIPEPPVELPIAEILSVSPEGTNGGTSIAKAVAAGAAAGAGAALAVFFIIAAMFND